MNVEASEAVGCSKCILLQILEVAWSSRYRRPRRSVAYELDATEGLGYGSKMDWVRAVKKKANTLREA